MRRRAGYVLVWLAAGLALFALLAGWQGAMLVAAARTARTFDAWRQQLAEAQRIERAVAEAALGAGETAEGAGAGGPAQAVLENLRRLDAGGAAVAVAEAPAAWPWTIPFPEPGANPGLLSAPAGTLSEAAPAELRRWLGPRVEEGAPCTVVTTVDRAIQGRQARRTLETELRLVSVPLTRFGLAAYELPEALGLRGGPVPTAAAVSELPAGLAPGRDGASRADWLADEGTLPYHHRRRASVATAYARVFSQGWLDRVAELAGPTHFHDLCQADPAATAVLAGLQRTAGGGEWDLGVAGAGRFGADEVIGAAALVVAREPGRRLLLRDGSGDPGAPPFLLVAIGPVGAAGAGFLDVVLETVLRPVMIVGHRARVVAGAGAVVRGAVFLGPDCVVAEGPGEWRVSHLSWAAAGAHAGLGLVKAGEPLPQSLEAWVPRARFVAATTRRREP